MFFRIGCVFVLVFALPLSARADDPKMEETLQGKWLPETAELAGQKFAEEVLKTIALEVKGDKYSVTVGKQVDQGTLKVDPEKKPKELDIKGTEGPNKGKTILAIYELDGDTLQVCYDLSGKGRPKAFATKDGTRYFLVRYKREQPSET